ncbi:MAG: gas vesicle synthesis GvpLGvpF [Candidatus Omnitrophica bacterium CG23_combo_of_CG06-09_8_20_14_all_40_11]|nr:MAG: gas vesicle synthesis GvpLGvpF [Candidatus Omnitrophica bacterium CG23_combo_of_CG06-09_8_20_14_all_40_11]
MLPETEAQKLRETIPGEGKYIYCIITIDNCESLNFGPLGIGGRGDELYTISYKPEGGGLAFGSQSHKPEGSGWASARPQGHGLASFGQSHSPTHKTIAAVVSNSPIKKYSVAREYLILHERAIEEVMKAYTVLPVRFATIAEDEKKVKTILEKDYDKILDLLEKMKGKIELGLKAIFKEGIYNYILKEYEEIRALKEKLQKLPLEKSYYQRMEIGKMVETALEKEKANLKENILNNLSPLALETKTNNTYGERMIINVAFLVEKNREGEFDQKIQELGAKYEDKVKFKYVGTLPPFNFVNLVIETGKY